MDIFNVLQNIYQNSNEKIMLCDESMKILWTNDYTLPRYLEMPRFIFPASKKITLPVTESISAEYFENYGKTYGVKITPLPSDDKIVGYILCFLDTYDVAVIADRSPYRNIECNFIGNVRLYMSRLLSLFDNNSELFNNDVLSEFENESRTQIMKTLGCTANFHELLRYDTGTVKEEFMDLGGQFEKLCHKIEPEISEFCDTFEYSSDIKACVIAERESFGIVIANLVANAVLYNKSECKKVILTLTKGTADLEGCGVLTVSDNGSGFTEEQIGKVTKPFGSFENFGEAENLGLAIARKFCDTFDCELRLGVKTGEFNEVKIIFRSLCDIDNDRLNSQPIFIPYNKYDNVSKILTKASPNGARKKKTS